MKTYHIIVQLKITTKETSYSDSVVAESEVKQAVTCRADAVRATATSIVKQAVDNMSKSAETGLCEAIAQERKDLGEAEEVNEKVLSI